MIRRLASAALAAVALAAAPAVLVPQHAASLALLAAGTLVVVAAVLVLVLAGALVAGQQPRTALDVAPPPGAPSLEPHGLRQARRDLAFPAAPGTVPPGVRDRLVRAGVPTPQSREVAAGATSDPGAVAALVSGLLDDPVHNASDGGRR